MQSFHFNFSSLISDWDEIFRAFGRLSVEPVTLNKYVTEYEQM